MRELIDRQAAMDALRNYLVGKNVPCDGTLTCRLIENEVISKLPSAQPEPKRGRWERRYSRPNVYADLFWHCSECGYKDSENYAPVYHHFCTNCGADMRQREEGET